MTREETQEIYAQLGKEALYALRSLSRDLVYQCYGKLKWHSSCSPSMPRKRRN